MTWEAVLPGVLRFRDSCNVYAVEGAEGCLVVDAGTGLWLEHLDELPARPVALACTHFFRDHTAGAVAAAKHGIPVFVPEGERQIFADPELHFLRRESYIVYDNYWDFFAPIEAIPVAGVLRDFETIRLAGLAVEWARHGIRLNAIAPGPIPTEGAFSRLLPTPEIEEARKRRIPAGRFGAQDELAELAAFLVSDASDWMRGEIVAFDGGEWLRGAGEFNDLLDREDAALFLRKFKRSS